MVERMMMVIVKVVMILMVMMMMTTMMMMMMIFDRLALKIQCVTGSTHGDRVRYTVHAPCASRTASRGGSSWDDDERRGETLRSEREWYQGDSRVEREGEERERGIPGG